MCVHVCARMYVCLRVSVCMFVCVSVLVTSRHNHITKSRCFDLIIRELRHRGRSGI